MPAPAPVDPRRHCIEAAVPYGLALLGLGASAAWKASFGPDLPRGLLVFLLMMGLVMAVVAVLDGMARKSPGSLPFMQWQPPSWAVPAIIITIWGPIFLVPVHFATRSLRQRLRRQRARTRDREAGCACIARVDGGRFISVMSKDGDEKLLFELDAARSLLFDGERPRYDLTLFGLPEPDYDDDDGQEDDGEPPEGAPGRTPFPNSSFDLHWLPHSGRMLRIETRGEVLAPLRVFLDSELPLPERALFPRGSECEVLLLERSLPAILAEARVTV